MKVDLNPGFHDADRHEVARLYWQAFGGKLGRVMAPERKALVYIRRVADPRHAICARAPDGTLVGIAGFKSARGALVDGGRADLRAAYGTWGALWRQLVLAAMPRDVDNLRFLVDGIAVRQDARGRGVGSALIEALCDEARTRGYREIRLDVIVENIRARALYERLGFVTISTDRSRFSAVLFGFASATSMVRRL